MNKKIIASLGLSVLSAALAIAQTSVPAGPISVDTAWNLGGSPYILEGLVYVDNGATLDIAPGVIIRGQPITTTGASDPGTLLITRTGRIQARGTSSNPIIFTAAVLDAGRKAGGAPTFEAYDSGDVDTVPDRWTPADGNNMWLDLTPATIPLAPVTPSGLINSKYWGGVLICGNAPTNSNSDTTLPADGIPDPGTGFVEGLNATAAGIYGGDNPFDDSGIFRYVSIRHAGFSLAPASEVNGLTLYGVGRGTSIDHVEIYCNVDDGVEVFGGTVDLSHLCIAFAEDDGFDTDQGYQGTAQYLYIVHGMTINGTLMLSSSDPRGMELDGDDAPGNVIPGGMPFEDTRIYNATVQVFGQQGVFMRNGFAGALVNSIVVTHSATANVGVTVSTGGVVSPQTSYADGALEIRNTTFNGWTTPSNTFGAYTPHTNAGFTFDVFFPATNNRTTTADMLAPTYATGGLNPRPGAGPGVPNTLAVGSTQDSGYVTAPAFATTYKGAFDPAAVTLWTTGWTALNKTNTDGIKLLVN
ncbi:MAG TPA: hypothetical protein VMM36_03060 [Opitutaceae bacterium]|nr:hypothetical protein [Opitutaceae bacterium]